MKHIVRKPYWNYEKEEKWLNEMAAKGLALTDYSWCRYVFEDSSEREYIYRIELFDYPAAHPDSQRKIKFFEEVGIEFVASYMRWVYLRKKVQDGPFDLYTDLDSRILHYKKIAMLWLTFAGIEFCAAAANIAIGIAGAQVTRLNLILGCIVLAMGLVFLGIGLPILKKVRRLKKQRELRES